MRNIDAVLDVLSRAESFISGFEDDELQEGIPELLADLREAQAALSNPHRNLAPDALPDYQNEAVLRLPSQAQIRMPAHPEPCTYIRVVDKDGKEVGYWIEDEWAEDPAEVMGAIMGAAMGESPEAEIHVVVTERDTFDADAIDNHPIVFETYTDKATLEAAQAFRKKVEGRYGKARIAKLVFLHV